MKSKGLCNRHYENLRLTGSVKPAREDSIAERINRIGWDVTAAGCWEWRGKRNDRGYGMMSLSQQGISDARVHRLVYELITGECLDDRVLLHSCDNPPCINPAHLTAGTPADNVRDMVLKGRHWMADRVECPNGHDLTLPGSTRRIGGKRPQTICVQCARARSLKYSRRVRSETHA